MMSFFIQFLQQILLHELKRLQQVYTVFTNISKLKRMELGGIVLEKVVMFLHDLFLERVVILLKKRNEWICVKSVK